jgi:uncharacterized membrane protein YbjE (DUF340 family)
VAFDPFLYVAFAAGFLAGRVAPRHGRWVSYATQATVVVLVGLLGALVGEAPNLALLDAIPVAVAFVAVLLGLTVALYFALVRWQPAPSSAPTSADPPAARHVPFSLELVAALLIGFAAGRLTGVDPSTAIPWALYALLALVGFDVTLTLAGLRRVWVPLAAALGGALAAGTLFALVGSLPLPVSLSTSLAFGFYSLVGPLVTARAGAVLGLIAFLANFLRENLTMVLSPYLGPRLKGAGLSAMGGATAMDTTLFFVTRYGEREAASLALATGFVLTLTATVAIPALLALPT